jgi:colanic acid biosynthesis glycosyl transferase WcaI
MSDIVVRRAEPIDAAALAVLHTAAFPDYFLTQLGPSFLRRYYAAFLSEPHTVVIGSLDGRLAGFVAGTTDLARFRRGLYRPNLLHFPLIVAGRFVTNRVVRHHVFSRLHHVRLAICSLSGRNGPHDQARSANGELVSSLFSICVEPWAQGTGVAEAVMTAYLDLERERGARMVRLSVFDDNARAIRFYERSGWSAVERDGDSIVYELSLAD